MPLTPPVDTEIADAILAHQLDLLRLEAGTSSRIIALLEAMANELRAQLAASDLTDFARSRMESLLQQATATIDEYYAQIQAVSDSVLSGVARAQVAHVASVIDKVLVGAEAVIPPATWLKTLVSNVIIMGAPSAEWWEKQGADVAFRFAQVVRRGIALGWTNEEIVRRIAGSSRTGEPGVMDIARQNARSLVHTSIMTVANEARTRTFEENADVIEGMVWLATLDPSTCPACGGRDGHVYDVVSHEALDGGPPWLEGPGALHWSCRCVASIKPKPIPGTPGGTIHKQRASSSGPVPAGMTFAEYLDRQGHEFQDEVLGKGRAQLWRDKGLTLSQLLDLRGNPLTLAQLEAKYARR